MDRQVDKVQIRSGKGQPSGDHTDCIWLVYRYQRSTIAHRVSHNLPAFDHFCLVLSE